MQLNPEYNRLKQQALNGKLTKEFFPYLFEYYIGNHPSPAVKDYRDFSRMFEQYLNTPVVGVNMIQPIEGLTATLPKIFNYLDIKYTENDTK